MRNISTALIALLFLTPLTGCFDQKQEVSVPEVPAAKAAQPKKKPSPAAPINADATYRVQKIADGDTITVVPVGSNSKKGVRIRFACVDAPEVSHNAQESSSKDPALQDQYQWGFHLN